MSTGPITGPHQWTGPVTDPGVARPGHYVCSECRIDVPDPGRFAAPCPGAEAMKWRTQVGLHKRNPALFGWRIDLIGSLTDWLFDPDTHPSKTLDVVASLTREDAQAVISELLTRDLDRRIRARGDA